MNGRLILMRHAEAVSAAPGLDDFDRPLTTAGRAAAARVAARLAQLPVRLLLHSPAARTHETALIINGQLQLPAAAVRAEDAIYLASAGSLRQLVQDNAAAGGCLLLIGHNPGVSELLQLLDAGARDARRWLAPADYALLDG